MSLDKMTSKSQQALLVARDNAAAANNARIEPVHLALALLGQADGLVYPLLNTVGVTPLSLRSEMEAVADRIPKAYGASQPEMGPELSKVLERADSIRGEMRDDYLSVEHIILALSEAPGPVGEVLRELGVTCLLYTSD